MKYQATRNAAGWAFNLRSCAENGDEDFDSDSDAEAGQNTNIISEETRLLNELDLSSREETVIYNPNPFSIAKINAASRSSRGASVTAGFRPKKTRTSPKKLSGSIVDSFKKQAERAKKNHITKLSDTLISEPKSVSAPPNRPASAPFPPLIPKLKPRPASSINANSSKYLTSSAASENSLAAAIFPANPASKAAHISTYRPRIPIPSFPHEPCHRPNLPPANRASFSSPIRPSRQTNKLTEAHPFSSPLRPNYPRNAEKLSSFSSIRALVDQIPYNENAFLEPAIELHGRSPDRFLCNINSNSPLPGLRLSNETQGLNLSLLQP